MIRMNLNQAETLTGGTLIGRAISFFGISTDSRKPCDGRLFVALNGVNYKGSDFCQQAVDQGAVAIMTDMPLEMSVPQIICRDVLVSMGALAKGWIQKIEPTVIAVTGSNGKTTVKNMLQAVLSQQYKCFSTIGNFNNEVGVPLTALDVPPDTKFAVFEMGASKPGDISYLTDIIKPDVALVNNVSAAHLAGFGDLQAIADEKSEIYRDFKRQGLAVINADMPYDTEWRNKTSARILTYGSSELADYRLCSCVGSVIECELPGNRKFTMNMPIPGQHNAYNILAVLAILDGLSIPLDVIHDGLNGYRPEAGRLQELGKYDGVSIIHDAYNANPASVKAAIDVLYDMDPGGLLVLGDMKELGDETEALHKEVLDYAQERGLNKVLIIGQIFKSLSDLYAFAIYFDDHNRLIAWLEQHWRHYKTVLFKASRSMSLDTVIDALVKSRGVL